MFRAKKLAKKNQKKSKKKKKKRIAAKERKERKIFFINLDLQFNFQLTLQGAACKQPFK